MAPRKRKSFGEVELAKTEPTMPTSARVTRSSTRRANANSSVLSPAELPKQQSKKKLKTRGKKEADEEKVETKTDNGEVKQEEKAEELKEKQTAVGDDLLLEENQKKKTIVIEHCKQCNSFKTRAFQVKDGLENGVPGITVLLNPDKPRRGCFEIREQGGEKFISLLDMKRPFKPMKALDMDELILKVIDKIK